MEFKEEVVTRFWSKVDKKSDDECWEWLAGKSKAGYGRISINDYPHYSHRLSYIISKGVIMDELHVLHKCDNPSCVNPNHLFLGTHLDNIIDRTNKKRGANHNTYKIHCKHGHEFNDSNTGTDYRGNRYCKTCSAKSQSKYRNKNNTKIIGKDNKLKTHCPHGHEYTLENTFISKQGSRKCRVCMRVRNHINYAKKSLDNFN